MKSFSVSSKVSLIRALSSAVVLWITSLSLAAAHEVLPSITDMTEVDGKLVFEMSANLESFVAGIDLTETSDTNDAPQAASYDVLRALEPPALEQQFRSFWPQMAGAITILADGQPLTPELDNVIVGPVGNIEAVRSSDIVFSADLPEGTQKVQVGWDRSFGVLVVRQMGVDAPYDGYLEAGSLSDPISLSGGDQATAMQSFLRYIPVGFDHIVPKGLDHILFVLGLFFLAARVRPLLLQVSLFTLAHTITLALAALGHTKVLDDFFVGTFNIEFIAVVEPLIAASIVYVAVENIFMKGISPWRPFAIFLFGLLHGLGFASVLSEFGLPEETFVAALIGFNVGVEVGQLAVIGVMLLCVWQALRIDRGRNEAGQGFALYGVLTVVAIALALLNPQALETALENPVWLFAAPLAGVFVLCAASIQFRDHLESYRVFVAVPCSAAIALVGTYWFVERVFL
ncbi:HupE/UreJ family protein [Yoonia sediminilitoris]|uniref:HupE/UreJ protein n=1 Tax=Yoonia sediminilitoris TaxID=1286148 RepID=A0A2T6KD06_9RHOB|nr:HupE/UreJ family protein [Yoonia sediminilitoris]PUB12827.1 HupE/UreJ protein [Yoonia sediminilitoris]RCW94306.1 HupE/UreJ protein [Yoonia sediminilitoris]